MKKMQPTLKTSTISRIEVLAMSLAINLLGLALPLALLQVYDRIIPNQAEGTVFLLASGVFIAILLEASLRIARTALVGEAAAKYENNLNRSAFEQILKTDIIAFENVSAGEHLNRLGAIPKLREYYSGAVAMAVMDIPFAILFLGILYYLAGWLAFAPVSVFLLIMLISIINGQKLKHLTEHFSNVDTERATYFIGVITKLFTVKIMSSQQSLRNNFNRLQEDRSTTRYEMDLQTNILSDLSNFGAQLSLVLVVGIGSYLVLNGELTIGVLAASTLLVGRGLQPLRSLIGYWARAQVKKTALADVKSIFDMPIDPFQVHDKSKQVNTIQGSISIKGMSYKFPGNQKDTLKNINLDIQKNEMVALTGPNNSGKSVLLMLIAGLIEPSKGVIKIDGHPIRNINQQLLRKSLVLLPQHEVLFDGTVMENITMFRPEKKAAGEEAIRILDINKMLNALPNGVNTVLGNGPQASLPRGLAQRIAMTRALIDSPRIILFDDANSAVDHTSDRAIKSFMEDIKGKCTIIMVSHRPSLLNVADRILHIAEGELELDEAENL